jgi:hypothetical protein
LRQAGHGLWQLTTVELVPSLAAVPAEIRNPYALVPGKPAEFLTDKRIARGLRDDAAATARAYEAISKRWIGNAAILSALPSWRHVARDGWNMLVVAACGVPGERDPAAFGLLAKHVIDGLTGNADQGLAVLFVPPQSWGYVPIRSGFVGFAVAADRLESENQTKRGKK